MPRRGDPPLRPAHEGDFLAAGKTVTGFANVEEDFADNAVWEMGALSRDKHVMPWRIEDELKRLGANYVQAGLWRGFAVRDGNLITGQQNFSGGETARAWWRRWGNEQPWLRGVVERNPRKSTTAPPRRPRHRTHRGAVRWRLRHRDDDPGPAIAVPTPKTVSIARLPGALRQLAPQVLVYVISFVNLGVLWIGQHNQYHFIGRTDRWFLWINIAYLLLISFMPLSTALLGNYPLERLALFVYGANLLAATLVLALHWHYATARGRLMAGRLSPGVVRVAHRRILGSACAYALALLLSLLVPVAGLALFLAVPFVNILPFAVDRHLHPGSRRLDAGS